MLLKYIRPLLIMLCFGACEEARKKPNSVELIADKATQEAVFVKLVSVINNVIPDHQLKDSLAFLVLPVKLSCPACRKKTIDSIVKHKDNLLKDHFIIISASEGRKNISSYFQEEDHEIPVMENQLFLDSNHQAYKFNLVKENPVIYYTAHKKAYKRVSAIPATVKEDLREFFSGTRQDSRITKK